MSKLTVNNLNFSYGSKKILEDVSFSLDKGFVTIIGPNGAGKTTLLKLMNGLLKPESGLVSIWGQNVNQLNSLEKARLFTTIHQTVNFSFPYTVMEIVSHGRYPHSKHRITGEDLEIIVKVMKETDCLKYKDHLVTQLSGGELQRVILAIALTQEPKILFIDEGFSALDIRYKKDMMSILKNRVEKEDLLVVSIIHDLNLAYTVSDQVIVLGDQKMQCMGKPNEAMNMNLLEKVYQVEFNRQPNISFQINI